MNNLFLNTNPITISDHFNGLALNGVEHRVHNLEKCFSTLRAAIDEKQVAYLVESTHEVESTLSVKLKKMESQSKYLLLQTLNRTTKLVVFTNADIEQLEAVLNECMFDYQLNCLGNAADTQNVLPIARAITHLARHQTIGKAARKAKEFSGSSLSIEQKTKTVRFELMPVMS